MYSQTTQALLLFSVEFPSPGKSFTATLRDGIIIGPVHSIAKRGTTGRTLV